MGVDSRTLPTVSTSSVDETLHDQVVGGTGNLMIWQKWENGTAMWAPMEGQWFSSARAELMGLITAMLLPVPIHVGIDNANVVNNFGKLKSWATANLKPVLTQL